MSMMEIMTCVRHNIPVTAVVFHNRQWGAEKKNQVDFYNRRFVAGELDNESFAEMARAMGAEGITVDKLEDVGPALKKAIDMQMNEGKTCVIEIMCTRELGDPFRRDALAKPVRFSRSTRTTSEDVGLIQANKSPRDAGFSFGLPHFSAICRSITQHAK
jgi:sulfoacetaldehyde acetyltransferase